MSKRKTNDEFLKELNNINPNIYPLDKYIASSEKIRCRCKIDGHEWYAIPNNLLRGEGCPKCKYVGFAHARSKSHNNFVSQVLLLNNNIEIIGRYINNKTKVKCRCKIDEYEWEAQPSHLLRGSGCPVCSNKIIIHGINDVATTHPQYIKYFKNADDAMKYSEISDIMKSLSSVSCIVLLTVEGTTDENEIEKDTYDPNQLTICNTLNEVKNV